MRGAGAVCGGCLAGGRRVRGAGRLAGLLRDLAQVEEECPEWSSAEVQVCWECEALLRKIAEFKFRVRRSTRVLYGYLKQPGNLVDELEEITKLCSSQLKESPIVLTNSVDLIPNAETVISGSNERTSPIITDLQDTPEVKTELIEMYGSDIPSPLVIKEELHFNDVDDLPLSHHKKKKVKRKVTKKVNEKGKKYAKPTCDQYQFAPIIVTEEQHQQWRRSDATSERYARAPHKCSSCIVGYNFSDQLDQHNARKHSESAGPIACDICACRYASESEMRAHRELHYMQYACLHCQHVTRDKKEIVRHYAMQHSDATYQCKDCDAVFKTASHLRYHKDDKHSERWKCKHCDKTFRLRNNMYAHMLTHKQLPEAPCPVCGKTMRNKYALKTHLKTHEVQRAAWYCQPCGTHYKSETGYKNHLTSSMKHASPDKLKYTCEACGRCFITEKRRRRHYNSVHLKKSEFECDKCNKSYSTKMALRNHMQQKHDDTYAGPIRDKVCDICGKSFAVIGILKSHMRTHTGERPFQCELCPSAFSHRAALYTHNRLVHLKLKRARTVKKVKQPQSRSELSSRTDSRALSPPFGGTKSLFMS